MKALILIAIMMVMGCNIIALEARDPQDPDNVFITDYIDIRGNWYYTDSDYVRIYISEFNLTAATNSIQKGYLKADSDEIFYQYSLKNDTLNVFYENSAMSFVRK